MPETTSEPAEETAAYVALRRLQNSYADIVTRRDWAALADIFLHDCTVEIDRRTGEPLVLEGPGAVGGFIADAISGFEFFEFVILNTVLEIDPADDRAGGGLYMSELRQDAASKRWTTVYGVYHDRYRRIDGRWWFARRRYHSLARTGADVDVFPFPHHLRIDDV